MGLLFGDVWAEDSAPVDLDRRVDDFRAINSITLRQLIGSHLENGRVLERGSVLTIDTDW